MASKKKSKKKTKKSSKKSKKKSSKKSAKKKEDKSPSPESALEKMPEEVKKKLKDVKGKIEKFQKSILDKFDEYIVGIGLLPPAKKGPQGKMAEGMSEDDVNLLVLVDDSDSKKMSKRELKEKLTAIIKKEAEDIDEKLKPNVFILSEVWQSCYDGKYDLLQMIGMCAPIYDKGTLGGLKVAEIHKQMVLKKFDRYIVSYVLFGSLARGEAHSESDVDVAVIIDDTDVKKMTRAELKDKLRAIIYSMSIQAQEMTGMKKPFQIQTYILTDFWDGVREANPVYFTLLRDGIPLFDRGTFMPWKHLLKMGRIKPSQESIDMYMRSGEQYLEKVKKSLNEIGVEYFYWATVTPSQAALMLYGMTPPAPNHTPDMLREVFVEKEGLLKEKDIKAIEKVLDIRKDIEHGKKKEISGEEIDELLELSENYLKRIKKLFSQIESIKEKENLLEIYDNVVTICRDILSFEGVSAAKDEEILDLFEEKLIHTGNVPAKYQRSLEKVIDGKKAYEEGNLAKSDVSDIRKEARELIKHLVEHLQRTRGKELEKARLRVKHGEHHGEVLLLEDEAFIIHDVDVDEKQVSRAKIKKDGSLGTVKDSTYEEFEKALAKHNLPQRVFVRSALFESLEKVFGEELEVQMHR